MKKMLVATLFSVAALAGTQTSAQAGTYGFGLNINLGLSFSASCSQSGSCCQPPCWSGCYPQPIPYGGYYAMNSYAAQYQPPPWGYAGYPGAAGNYGGYYQGQAVAQPATGQAPPPAANAPPSSPPTRIPPAGTGE